MASEWKRFLEEEGYEKFKEAMRLSDEDSKDDPEDDPFRSKYRSREILLEVKEKLKPHLEKFREQDQELVFLDCVIDLRLGVNYIDTEELHSGEEYLVKVIDCTEKYKLDKNAADIYLHALNNLGILWFGRRNPEKALSYLLKAEELYFQYKKEVDGPPKFVAEYLKSAEDEKEKLEHLRNANFENSYTHTLYYMAQVYAKLDESEKSALCCHKTLQRQLDAHKYTPLDWAINAATLSQYFVTKDEYPQARHCLACAEVIFEEIQFSENENVSEDEKEKVQQGKADIQRCWAKYGLALLEFSKDRLLKATEEDTPLDPDETEKEFEKFNLEVTSREEQITCKPVRDFEEGRNVFLRVQTWLSGAKEFYVFDGRCTDYIELVQDHSKAFKLLAFFELNMDRQCKMHKRRADMLLEVCNELNPQHYLLIVRQLIYELAEIYSGIMDIKYMILKEEGGQPSVHAIKKINSLALQSIQKYQAYIDSFKDNKPDLPDEYPELDTRPILVAWFCMGRLYSKILPLNVRERLDNVKKTETCYQYIIDYCKRHHNAAECMRPELEVCEEMVALLPLKMEKIRQEADI